MKMQVGLGAGTAGCRYGWVQIQVGMGAGTGRSCCRCNFLRTQIQTLAEVRQLDQPPQLGSSLAVHLGLAQAAATYVSHLRLDGLAQGLAI